MSISPNPIGNVSSTPDSGPPVLHTRQKGGKAGAIQEGFEQRQQALQNRADRARAANADDPAKLALIDQQYQSALTDLQSKFADRIASAKSRAQANTNIAGGGASGQPAAGPGNSVNAVV